MQPQDNTKPLTKRCGRCHEERALEQFYATRSSKDGKASWCKLCKKDHHRETHPRKPADTVPEGMKRCGRCREIKAITEFYKVSARQAKRLGGGYKDGLEYRCKQCAIQHVQDRHARSRIAPRKFNENKTCARCGETKPRSCFSINRQREDWLDSFCHECDALRREEKAKRPYNRSYYYGRTHGVTVEQFTTMIEEQHGLCAICGLVLRLEAGVGALDKPYLDHSHVTGKLRAVLCRYCNWHIGHLENEMAGWRDKAFSYLEKYK